jgi:hypothetical protein
MTATKSSTTPKDFGLLSYKSLFQLTYVRVYSAQVFIILLYLYYYYTILCMLLGEIFLYDKFNTTKQNTFWK